MKKEIIKTFGVFIITAHLIGCQNSDPTVHRFTEFENELLLKSKKIALNENYKHARLHFYDTLCILTNTPESKQQIHLYNRNYEYITSSGLIGKGPGEITNPFLAVLDEKNKSVWMMDMGRKELLKFPVDSMLLNPNFLPQKSIPIPNDYIIMQYSPYKDNMFTFSDLYTENALISVIDQSGELVDSLQIKKSDKLTNLDNRNSNQIKLSFLYAKHPKKNIYALAYRFSDKIAIINSKGKLIAGAQGPDIINQKPEGSNKDLIRCYTDIHCDQNYIYALYRGSTLFDSNNEIVYPKTIHVFNWKGKPIARLKLPHPVMLFSLDNSTNGFVSFSQLTGGIVYFSLPSGQLMNP